MLITNARRRKHGKVDFTASCKQKDPKPRRILTHIGGNLNSSNCNLPSVASLRGTNKQKNRAVLTLTARTLYCKKIGPTGSVRGQCPWRRSAIARDARWLQDCCRQAARHPRSSRTRGHAVSESLRCSPAPPQRRTSLAGHLHNF